LERNGKGMERKRWEMEERETTRRKVMPGACLLSNEAHTNVRAHPSTQSSQCYLALSFYLANRWLTSSSAIADRPHCRVGQYQPKVEDDILQTF